MSATRRLEPPRPPAKYRDNDRKVRCRRGCRVRAVGVPGGVPLRRPRPGGGPGHPGRRRDDPRSAIDPSVVPGMAASGIVPCTCRPGGLFAPGFRNAPRYAFPSAVGSCRRWRTSTGRATTAGSACRRNSLSSSGAAPSRVRSVVRASPIPRPKRPGTGYRWRLAAKNSDVRENAVSVASRSNAGLSGSANPGSVFS